MAASGWPRFGAVMRRKLNSVSIGPAATQRQVSTSWAFYKLGFKKGLYPGMLITPVCAEDEVHISAKRALGRNGS